MAADKVDDLKIEVLRKDKQKIWVRDSFRTVRDSEGKAIYFEGFVEQVAQQDATESALRETQAWNTALAENSAAAVAVKDRNGRYLFANKRFQDMNGLKLSDILGKTPGDIFHGEAGLSPTEHDREVLESGRPVEREETLPTLDGPRTFVVSKFPIENKAGDGSGGALGLIATDITDRKAAEESLRESRQRLDDALDSISEGFSLYDADDRLVLCTGAISSSTPDWKALPFRAPVRDYLPGCGGTRIDCGRGRERGGMAEGAPLKSTVPPNGIRPIFRP